MVPQQPGRPSQMPITLMHDDDDDDDLLQYETESTSTELETGKPILEKNDQSSSSWNDDTGDTTGTPQMKLSHHHNHIDQLPLDKVPIPSLANNFRKRVSPYLLFRNPLTPSPHMLGCPWYTSTEDVKLDSMWKQEDHQHVKSNLANIPSTAHLTQLLKCKRRGNRRDLANRDDVNASPLLDSRTCFLVNQTRSLLEKQQPNISVELDELKGKEESLLGFHNEIQNLSVLKLAGIDLQHTINQISFPLRSDIDTLLSSPPQSSTWYCNVLTLKNLCDTFLSFNPPLFTLSTTTPSPPTTTFAAPLVQVPMPVIEKVGLVIETQLKCLLKTLLNYAQETVTEKSEHPESASSNDVGKNHKHQRTITIDTIDLLTTLGGLDFLESGALIAQLRIRTYKLSDINKATENKPMEIKPRKINKTNQ